MKKDILKLFLILSLVVYFSSCSKDEGTAIGNDSKPMATLYSYKADPKLYNPENDAFVRVAVNNKVNECYYLAEKTIDREKQLKSLGETAYIEHVVSKGTKIGDISKHMTADFYVKDLKGDYTITVVVVGNDSKSFSSIKFIGLDWEDLGKAKYTSSFFGNTSEVSLQKLKGGDMYQIKSAYKAGYNLRFTVNKDNSVTFEKQKTGYVHKKYGMVSFGPQLQGSKKDGNIVSLIGKFTVSVGAFDGEFTETLELPK